MKVKRWLAILLFLGSIIGSQVACGKSDCTSQYNGCSATAEAIATVAARPGGNSVPIPTPRP